MDFTAALLLSAVMMEGLSAREFPVRKASEEGVRVCGFFATPALDNAVVSLDPERRRRATALREAKVDRFGSLAYCTNEDGYIISYDREGKMWWWEGHIGEWRKGHPPK